MVRLFPRASRPTPPPDQKGPVLATGTATFEFVLTQEGDHAVIHGTSLADLSLPPWIELDETVLAMECLLRSGVTEQVAAEQRRRLHRQENNRG